MASAPGDASRPGPTPDEGGGLSWRERARLWDGCAHAVRGLLRDAGLVELFTPARVAAPAIEPWIEVLAAPPGYLRTSPELAIKRALTRGVGSCFELAKVFRAGEIGDWHREEFHLLEWYRVAEDDAAARDAFTQLRADVEAVVERAGQVAGDIRLAGGPAPTRWESWTFDEVWAETAGFARPADELGALEVAARTLQVDAGVSAPGGSALFQRDAPEDPEVAVLAAWSELFSWWSDGALDPWLEARASRGVGVHITHFPAPLAALAQVEGQGAECRAMRFESFIGRVELANGYLELADPAQQRRRFERVSGMRQWAGLDPLPLDEAFIAELEHLPPCAGVALGFERLLAWATGVGRLADLSLELGAPGLEG